MSGALANKRVLIYARYSSANQRDASIEDQLRRCADYVRHQGGTVDDELVFSDAAISGSSLSRPAFERVMALVQEKKVDVVVTEDVSRISRDYADSAAVLRRLEYEGVRLIGIADGIDTAMGGSKLLFGVKSAMNEAYLDDLRYKTKRGLEGRCRAGYSTGGLPLGYRTEAALSADGRVIGRRIVIDEANAAIVRRIFEMYVEGHSFDAIAKTFNAGGIPYARLGKNYRRQGWVASSVRAILYNRAYIGEWTWNRQEWRKLPGTNTRRPRARRPEEVIAQTFPERRIVDADLWDRARRRASQVAAKYKSKGGTSAPGNRTKYPLSGLLTCGVCGAAMVISAGTSASYYICGDAKKRGTCANRTMLREDAARAAILGAVRDALFTPAAVTYLRKRIAERLRARAQSAESDLKERVDRLRRTEDRIHGLVKFIAEGDDSKYVRETLRDLEAQAKIDSEAVATLQRELKSPVRLPTPDDLVERARDFDRIFAADPVRARELLRGVFENGKIEMHPEDGGGYIARATFLPLAAVVSGNLSERDGTCRSPCRWRSPCRSRRIDAGRREIERRASTRGSERDPQGAIRRPAGYIPEP